MDIVSLLKRAEHDVCVLCRLLVMYHSTSMASVRTHIKNVKIISKCGLKITEMEITTFIAPVEEEYA